MSTSLDIVRTNENLVFFKCQQHDVHSREAGTKAPQHASFPNSSSTKLALRSGAKGLSLSADSVAYAASAPKGVSKTFSRDVRPEAPSKANRLRSSTAGKAPQRAPLSSSSSTKLAPGGEARTEALFGANPFCGDKRSRILSYVRSKRASALDCLGSNGPDLRELLASKRKSEFFRTTPCCR